MRRVFYPDEWIRPWWLAMLICYGLTIINTVTVIFIEHGTGVWPHVFLNVWVFVFSCWMGRSGSTAFVTHQREQRNKRYNIYDGLWATSNTVVSKRFRTPSSLG